MAVVHMMRSEGREGDFPTECGAVGNVRLTGTWDEVTCNNCIRKFGPDAAKKEYRATAKAAGVKLPPTAEEKSVDGDRLKMEALISHMKSQILRMEGVRVSILAMQTEVGAKDPESIICLLNCAEYLEAAISEMWTVNGTMSSIHHGEGGTEDESDPA